MTTRLLIYLFSFFFFPVCYADESQKMEQRRLDAEAAFSQDFVMEILGTRTLRTLITQEHYVKLESLLGKLELQFTENAAYEHAWIMTYYNIRDLAERDGSEQAMLAFFDRWIETSGSHTAHAARGSFLTGLAWHHRGGRSSVDTSSDKFVGMEHYARLASRSFLKALELEQSMLPAHIQLISLGRMTSDIEQEKKFYELGLRAAPTSYWLRWEYLSGLEPKWGGSMEDMVAYTQSLKGAVDGNPRLWRLIGRPFAYEGNRLGHRKNYESAMQSYTQALGYVQHPVWLARRAFYAYRLQLYSAAIADIKKVIPYGRSVDHAIHLIDRIEQESVQGLKRGEELFWSSFDINIAR